MKRRALVVGVLAMASAPVFALHDEIIHFTRPDGFQGYKIIYVRDPEDDEPKPAYKSKPNEWQYNGIDPGTGDIVYKNKYTGDNILVDPNTRNIKLPK